MYEKIEKMMTTGFRLLTALVLFVAGFIWQTGCIGTTVFA